MAKSFTIFVTLCLLVCMMTYIISAAPSIGLKLLNANIIAGAPTDLEITLNSVAFGQGSISFPNNQLGDYMKPYDAPYFAQNTSYGCVDSTTGQVVGNLGNDFRLGINSSYRMARLQKFSEAQSTNPGDVQTTLVIKCPVVIQKLPEERKLELNNIDYYIDSSTMSSGDERKATLTFPDTFVHPIVDFQSAVLSQPKSFMDSGKLTVEFTTDTVGQYLIQMANGLTIIDRSRNEFKHGNFYCSAGSNKKAVRIVFGEAVWLIVDQASPKTAIKCEFNVIMRSSLDVRSEKLLIRLSLGNFDTSRSVSYSLVPGILSAWIYDSGDSHYIDVYLENLQASSTPLNVNSTVVFRFGSQVDVTTLLLDSDQQEYRGFRCSNSEYATISFKGTNEIILKDFAQSVDSLSCYFEFQGESVFNYLKKNRMSSVEVFIDGKELNSLYTPGSSAPLYLGEDSDIFNIRSNTIQTKFENSAYEITQTITISDRYEDVHITPNDPVVILSLPNGNFKNEDLSSQLKCLHTTPTYSKLVPLDLKFDATFDLWMVHLPEIVGIESYTIKIECSYTVKQVLAYGIDITPRTGLFFEIVDLIDKKRYYSRRSSSSPSFPLQANPTTLPSGAQLPGDPTVRCAVQAYVQIPVEKVFEEVGSDIKTISTTFWTKAFEASSFKDDFTMAIGTKNQLVPTSDAGYINAQAQENTFNYYYVTLKNFFAGVDANVPDSFTNNAFSDIEGYSTSPSNTANTRQFLQISRKSTSTANFNTNTWSNTFFPQTSYSNYDVAVNKVIGKDTFVPLNTQASAAGFSIDQGGAYVYNCMDEKANPTTKCGYVSGALMTQSSLNFGDSFTWGQYSHYASELCHNGDECTANMDCFNGLVCQNSKCTPKTTALPPFIRALSSTEQILKKDFFSAGSTISYIVAAVAVIFVIVF